MLKDIKTKSKDRKTKREMERRIQEMHDNEMNWRTLMNFLEIKIDPKDIHKPLVEGKTEKEIKQILNNAYSKLAQIRAGVIHSPLHISHIEEFAKMVREYLDGLEKSSNK